MKELTARQREVLDAITDFRAEKGYLPSIRELGRTLGISSLRGVTIHLDALARKGWIKRESTSRSIQVLTPESAQAQQAPSQSIPLLGTIAAGVPLLAVENVGCYIAIPGEMASRADDLFALKVRGDSMVGDHITDGDTIVIRSQPSAEHGELVAALIGEEATVKRLDIKAQPPRLLPSNPNYEPIELVGDGVRILGKVVGLLRSYE